MIRRPAKNRRPGGNEILSSDSIVAPVKGWNTRDPIASMDMRYARQLDNLFPTAQGVNLRKGYTSFATGFSAPVETIMTWRGLTGEKLFAASGTGIYDVTAGGTIGAAVQSITNPQIVFVNYNTTGGSFLILVNGTDDLRYFNGTTWNTIVSFPISGGGTLNSADVANICIFKRSIFLVKKDSMSFYYLPIDSINGTVSDFPVGALFDRGGYLMAIGTWTVDGGVGLDDYTALITSEGQVAIYKGTDPGSATDWALQGVYNFAPPLGRKCCIKMGGDLLIVSSLGLFSMNAALESTIIDTRSTLSDTIAPSFVEAANFYGDNYGWEMIHYPSGEALFVNVPLVEGSTTDQYVMNTRTKAWCRFRDIQALCFETVGRELYAGTPTQVVKLWQDGGDAGAPVTAYVKTAYTYLRPRARLKQIRMVRPTITLTGVITVELGLDVDFVDATLFDGSVSNNQPQYRWDAVNATWDSAAWAGLPTPKLDWLTLSCQAGYAFSVRLRVSSPDANVSWFATDLLFETGALKG